MKAEQAALLSKASLSLEAATVLYEKTFYDFAVSRAYYSMFYVAEALLLAEGLSFSKHSGVISAFGQHFAKTERLPRELHRYLLEAQEARAVGDYDTGPGLTADQAAEHLERARRFLDLAGRSLTSPETPDDEEAGRADPTLAPERPTD